jgi:glycerophosphocholine phosphodiesterase GPCPD1
MISLILDRLWSAEVGIPCDTDIEYRYFIASIDPQIGNDMVHVRKWETHLKPRHISKDNESQIPTVETFGDINGVEKVDRGWLTNETILQFKFFNNPFHLKERVKNRLLYVKVIVRQRLTLAPIT